MKELFYQTVYFRNVMTALLLAAFFLSVAPRQLFAFSSADFYRAALSHKSINAFGAAVHCAHETGNWKSRLWLEGNNGAGIKTNKRWLLLGMPSIETTSPEDEGGKMVMRRASFRKYRTLDAFLMDYSRKIRDDYPLSCRYYKNVWGYLDGLYKGRNGKWATDRAYFTKLTAKAVQLAPEIYGPEWKAILKRQLLNAKGFRMLSPWQFTVIEERLGI